jgi:DNA-binding response OmpR family regulator
MTILRKIRKAGLKTPVLMLTAKDTVMDKVSGLDSGADDYLTKPFSFEELLARIRALLRRRSDIKASIIEIDDLVINMATHEVMRGGKQISLSPKEYALLEHIYDENSDFDSNVIDVFINRLRNKIDREFGKKLIHTVRGAGYILKE